MTLKKAIEFGKIFLKTIEDEKGSATYEFVEMAVKALKEKDILDKVRAEIIELRSKQNVGVMECLDIIDKYRK